MFYVEEIKIPANTSEKNAIKRTFKVTKGVIHRVEVHFPPGCAALAKVQIFRFTHQIFPTTRGTYFASDNETIKFRDHYEIRVAPAELTIKAWNEDDTYDHTVRVRIGIIPKRIAEPQYLFRQIESHLRMLLRRIGVFG